MSDYYYADGDVQKGPFPLAELPGCGVGPDTMIWHPGMPDWRPAREVPEFASLTGPEPLSPFVDVPISNPQPDFPPSYAGPHQAPPPVPIQQLGYSGYGPAGGAVLPNGMAVASMILGILSILGAVMSSCLCFMTTPMPLVAIVLGHIAYSRARRGEASGAGMAMAGFICGYIALAMIAGVIVFFVIAGSR